MKPPVVRELADRAREAQYPIALVVALVIGVASLATSTLIPVGAVLVLGGAGAILFAIIRAAQS